MSDDPLMDAKLAQAGTQHLQWLESYSQTPAELHVIGVDLLKAFSYELIQVLNHAYLQSVLNPTNGASTHA